MDVKIENHFSLFLFRLLTDVAQAWADENLGEDTQYFGNGFVCEPRYAGYIAEGMLADGLEVK